LRAPFTDSLPPLASAMVGSALAYGQANQSSDKESDKCPWDRIDHRNYENAGWAFFAGSHHSKPRHAGYYPADDRADYCSTHNPVSRKKLDHGSLLGQVSRFLQRDCVSRISVPRGWEHVKEAMLQGSLDQEDGTSGHSLRHWAAMRPG